MKKTALVNGTIITGGRLLKHRAVIIEGTRINNVVADNELPPDVSLVDLQGCYLSAGFIDLLVNGAGGSVFGTYPQTDGLRAMEEALLSEGTTGFLASAPTGQPAFYDILLQQAAAYRSHALGNWLGLHLEGPFLNPLYKGAHNAAFMQPATTDRIAQWLEKGKGEIRLMTLAPELQPSEVTKQLEQAGVSVSIGHSAATYEQALAFFNGAERRLVTHLYNGMQPMHHREPGMIPAIFHARPLTGIIADGLHVAYPMIRMAYEALGSEHLMLISDRFTPSIHPDIRYQLRGNHFATINEEGQEVLSGSALTMPKAVANCMHHVGIPLAEAVNMATHVPAKALGIDHSTGLVAAGMEANLAAFDTDFNIRCVFLKGRAVRGGLLGERDNGQTFNNDQTRGMK